MGNQQPTGRTRSDTYTRYERDGEDGRYVTLDQTDSIGSSQLSSVDERVRNIESEKILPNSLWSILVWLSTGFKFANSNS